MKGILPSLALLLIISTFSNTQLLSQDEDFLKRELEGKKVTLKMDMPATSEGVDIHPYESTPLDYDEYSRRIKSYGISIYSGDQIMITKIKKKKKHIEFQIGGGGYGTAGDESASVSVPNVPVSDEEKDLKDGIKKEKDKAKKADLEKKLRSLQRTRNLEQSKLRMEAQQLEAAKKEEIRNKAFQSGSRFNIRYDVKVNNEHLTVEAIKQALSKYIDFDNTFVVDGASPTSKTSEIHKGMLWEDAAVLLGVPKNIEQKKEGSLDVLSCSFTKDNQIIKTEFVEGVLVRYSISSK